MKPLIYKMSLSCYKTICPYCKYENPDSDFRKISGLPYANERKDICPCCGKQYDMDNIKVTKSKDYEEVEALGLKGAVTKNEKGAWIQA